MLQLIELFVHKEDTDHKQGCLLQMAYVIRDIIVLQEVYLLHLQQEECSHQLEVCVLQEDIENKDQNIQQDVHQELLVL